MITSRGAFIADSDSVTVVDAGELWMQAGEENGLVRSSLKQNRERLNLHIVPFVGDVKLSQRSVPFIRAFEGDLREGRLAADTAYGSAANLNWLVNEKQIAPHIPVIDKSKRDDGTFRCDPPSCALSGH